MEKIKPIYVMVKSRDASISAKTGSLHVRHIRDILTQQAIVVVY